MNRSTPGLPVHHQLPEFTQTHVHQVGDAVQPSYPLLSPSPPAPSPSQHQGLPMSQLFAWGGQGTGVSASASVLPMNTQDWSPLGRREGYIQLNAEFQKIARRDKKAFFNEQCLKTEENNKRGKTRDLFRKTGNIKGTFHQTMGTTKDKNGRDLIGAEEMERPHRRTI